eukprot:169619-Amphidinium_carterae.3
MTPDRPETTHRSSNEHTIPPLPRLVNTLPHQYDHPTYKAKKKFTMRRGQCHIVSNAQIPLLFARVAQIDGRNLSVIQQQLRFTRVRSDACIFAIVNLTIYIMVCVEDLLGFGNQAIPML